MGVTCSYILGFRFDDCFHLYIFGKKVNLSGISGSLGGPIPVKVCGTMITLAGGAI